MIPIAVQMNTLISMFRKAATTAIMCLSVHTAALATPLGPTPDESSGDASQSITVRDLAEINDIVALRTSPDGQFVAYLVRRPLPSSNNIQLSWFVLPTNGTGQAIKVADGGDYTLEIFPDGSKGGGFAAPAVAWSPDNQWLAFTKKSHEEIQIWRVRRDGSMADQLSRNAADVLRLAWPADGSRIYFTVGRIRSFMSAADKEEQLHGILVHDPLPSVYLPTRTPWPQCGEISDRYLIDAIKDRACARTLWVKEIESGIERLADPTEMAANRHLSTASTVTMQAGGREWGIRSATGNEAWFGNQDPHEFKGFNPPVALAASRGSKTISCQERSCRGQWQQRQLWWASGGKEILLLVSDGEAGELTSLYGWAPETGKLRTILRTDDVLDCANSGDNNGQLALSQLICRHQTWTHPDELVAIDTSSGTVTPLVDVNSTFRSMQFTRIRKLIWDDGFGGKPLAHLVYPAGYSEGRRYPLIVTTYTSKGFLRGATGDEQPIHVYAQRGFFVLSYNMSLTELNTASAKRSTATGAYSQWIKQYYNERPRELGALEKMLDRLNQEGLIDPRRIGITGFSSGDAFVSQSLIFSKRFAAASVHDLSPSPIQYYMVSSEGLRSIMRTAFGGKPFDGGLSQWKKRAVGLNARSINTPILIQVADREYTNTVQNFIDFTEAKRPIEAYIYADEYHTKWQPAHRLAVYSRNLEWFMFWLQDKEVRQAADPDQYDRWRRLRELQRSHDSERRMTTSVRR